MITVSESAKEEVLRLIKEDNLPANSFIRVGVKGGGCSGLSYEMDFDVEAKEEDKVFEDKGVKIVVDKKKFFIPHRNRTGIQRRTQRKRICISQPQCIPNLWVRREFLNLIYGC